MESGDQWDLVRFRLEQMDDTLQEARVLSQGGMYRGAVNRAYYAMFYAVQALMGANGLKSTKHRGAIAVFDKEFIKADVFPTDFSKWLHQIFDLRMGADYGDMYQVSQEKANQAIENATVFVTRIKSDLMQYPQMKNA